MAVPVIILLPFILHKTDRSIYSMVIIYPNGVLLLGIIYNFIKLFKSLENNNPFTINNVKILKNTCVLTFIMSFLFFLSILFMIFIIENTYINYLLVLFFLGLLFLGVSIALYILAQLMQQATLYKEENELTI